MKRLIISDTHIGSKYYKEEELIEFLNSQKYDQLILGGDIIDFIKIPRFTKRAIAIAKAIDYSKEIIYIVGNHETPLSNLVGQEVFGIKFVSRYEFMEGGRTFRIEHGDQYDDSNFVHNNIFMSLLSVVQNICEHVFDIDFTDIMTDWKLNKRKLRRVWDILKINCDVDVLICGHFHTPECVIWVQPDQSIKTYINTGDWVKNQSYVLITDGVARLNQFDYTGYKDELNERIYVA